jgi:hypothetical protein
MCEDAISAVEASGLLDPRAARTIWHDFLARNDRGGWSPAFTLCVLGAYLRKMGERPGEAAAPPSGARPSAALV